MQSLSSGARTHGGTNGLTQLFDAGTPAIHIRTMLLLHARLSDDIGNFISELGNLRRVLLDVLKRLITQRLRHWCSLLSQPSRCSWLLEDARCFTKACRQHSEQVQECNYP